MDTKEFSEVQELTAKVNTVLQNKNSYDKAFGTMKVNVIELQELPGYPDNVDSTQLAEIEEIISIIEA